MMKVTDVVPKEGPTSTNTCMLRSRVLLCWPLVSVHSLGALVHAPSVLKILRAEIVKLNLEGIGNTWMSLVPSGLGEES